MTKLALVLCPLCLATACTSDAPTGSSCPTTDAPSYDNFARPFFATYCTGCHGVLATDRHGAPSNQNYDSEADIRLHARDIDENAAFGPDAANAAMPELAGPVAREPSDAERDQLGNYLACLSQ